MASSVSIPLSENTVEYGMIEYFLQLSCRTSLVKVRTIWSLHMPTVENAFSQRSKGLLAMPTWIPVSQLDNMNNVQDVS